MGGNNQAWAFRYFGGATVPLNKTKSPKTFEELAEYENDNTENDGGEITFKRLGVLRMDIDKLGQIFLEGFNEFDEKAGREISRNGSFSAYATLSGLLDLFFQAMSIQSVKNLNIKIR